MDAINEDAPANLPPPRMLADRCMGRAWDDDCDDGDRLLLEQAALTITHLLARLAVATEHAEARRARR
jgi:hypothetical protein